MPFLVIISVYLYNYPSFSSCFPFKRDYIIPPLHYNDVVMTTMASQITSLTVVYSTVYSDVDQRKHQSSASLAFVWGIHRDRWIPRTKGQLRVIMIMPVKTISNCPACRTYLIATRFWVVVICPIIKCLTVLEFSFILFDLCLFITIFNLILNYVSIVTFWIFTYHKIWILLIIFCFIWNYWIIYF